MESYTQHKFDWIDEADEEDYPEYLISEDDYKPSGLYDPSEHHAKTQNVDYANMNNTTLEKVIFNAIRNFNVDKIEDIRQKNSLADDIISNTCPSYLWLACSCNRFDIVDNLLKTIPNIMEKSTKDTLFTPEAAFLKNKTLHGKKIILEMYPDMTLNHQMLHDLRIGDEEYEKIIPWFDTIDSAIVNLLMPIILLDSLNDKQLPSLIEYDKKGPNVLEKYADTLFLTACNTATLAVCKYLLEVLPHIDIHTKTGNIAEAIPTEMQHIQTFFIAVTSPVEPLEKMKWLYDMDEEIGNVLQNTNSVEPLLNTIFDQLMEGFTLNLDLMDWLLSIKPDFNIHMDDDFLFEHFCEKKEVSIQGMEWVYKHSPVEKYHHHFFEICCRNDNVEGAAWLLNKHPEILDPTHVADPDPPSLGRANLYGRTFYPGQPSEEERYDSGQSYEYICQPGSIDNLFIVCYESGALNSIKWLYSLGVITLFHDNPSVVLEVFIQRYTSVESVKWLLSSFPEIDITANDYKVFFHCCNVGNLQLMEYIYSTYPGIDLRADGDLCFHKAFQADERHVCEWLASKESAYHFIVNDMRFEEDPEYPPEIIDPRNYESHTKAYIDGEEIIRTERSDCWL